MSPKRQCQFPVLSALLAIPLLACSQYARVDRIPNGGDSPPFANYEQLEAGDLSAVGPEDAIAHFSGTIAGMTFSDRVRIDILAPGEEAGLSKSEGKERGGTKSTRKGKGTSAKDEGKHKGESKDERKGASKDEGKGASKDEGKGEGKSKERKSVSKSEMPSLDLYKSVSEWDEDDFQDYVELYKGKDEPRVLVRLILHNLGNADFQGRVVLLDHLSAKLKFNRTHAVFVRTKNIAKIVLGLIPFLGWIITGFMDDWSFSEIDPNELGLAQTVRENLVRYEIPKASIEEDESLVIDFEVGIVDW